MSLLLLFKGAGGGAAPAGSKRVMLVAGQSLASPNVGSVVYSSTPSARHKRDSYGVRCRSTDIVGTAVGLYEQATDTGYGDGETIASAFCKMHDLLSGNANRWYCGNHAKSGETLAGIRKGGTATCFADGMAQADAALDAGYEVCDVVVLGHGETDSQNANTTYPAGLDTLQNDYDTDIKAITGQSEEVVLYCWQTAAYPPGSTAATGTDKSGNTALTYLDRAVNQPTKFSLIGSIFPGWFRADGLHITAAWTQVMACYAAKQVWRRDEGDDAPFRPLTAVRTAATIVVTFDVPAPPLVWRFDLYQPTTTGNTGALLGFKFFDDSGAIPAVTAVAITGASEVTVTLASTPTGTQGSQELRIAHSTSQNSGTGGTPLADSDDATTPSDIAVPDWPMPNFCPMSYVAVTT
jgi:hypothetical protein